MNDNARSQGPNDFDATIEIALDDDDAEETTLLLQDHRDRPSDPLPFAAAQGRVSPHSVSAGPTTRVGTGTLDPMQAGTLGLLLAERLAAQGPVPPARPSPPAPPKPALVLDPPKPAPSPEPPKAPKAPEPNPISKAAEGKGWRPAPRPAPSAPEGPALSALSASNAAADASSTARGAAAPPPRPSSPAAPLIEVLFYEPDLPARVKARYKPIFAARRAPQDDEGIAADKLKELRAKREVGIALAGGEPLRKEALEEAFQGGFQEGVLVPPLVLVSGEITLPFDEAKELDAVVSAAAPFADGDKALLEVLEDAKTALKAPRVSGPSTVTAGIAARIVDVFSRGKRRLPPRYLEEHTERLLLDERPYQRRTLFGEPLLRAVIAVDGGGALPAYLPERVRDDLPLFQRFRARIFAEARARADRAESEPVALRVLALGRVL